MAAVGRTSDRRRSSRSRSDSTVADRPKSPACENWLPVAPAWREIWKSELARSAEPSSQRAMAGQRRQCPCSFQRQRCQTWQRRCVVLIAITCSRTAKYGTFPLRGSKVSRVLDRCCIWYALSSGWFISSSSEASRSGISEMPPDWRPGNSRRVWPDLRQRQLSGRQPVGATSA